MTHYLLECEYFAAGLMSWRALTPAMAESILRVNRETLDPRGIGYTISTNPDPQWPIRREGEGARAAWDRFRDEQPNQRARDMVDARRWWAERRYDVGKDRMVHPDPPPRLVREHEVFLASIWTRAA